MWQKLLKESAQRGSKEGSLPRCTPALLMEIWPVLIGEELAQTTRPVILRGTTLHLAVGHVALAEQWQRSPMPLLRRLREFSPWPVDSLEITVDPMIKPPPVETPEPVSAEEPAPARLGVEGIDEELAAIIDRIHAHRKS